MRVAVAISGGRDSTALLHCTLRTARPAGIEVFALHVHHGLMADADAWLKQVQAQSRRWGASFLFRRLQSQPAPGDSIEAWARRERYRALGEMAREAGCALVLLAHHRRDQAETWLLQALRGAGSAGLSAMPRSAQRAGLVWTRPWLDMPSSAIEAYATRHRLAYVQDPSNHDLRFARGRVRQLLGPAMLQAFPDAEHSLARATRHAQDAAALAHEVALLDLGVVQHGDLLAVDAWKALPPARRGNALRAWLAHRMGVAAPASLVERLLSELPDARLGRWPAPAGHELLLYRHRLSAEPASTAMRRPDQHKNGDASIDLSQAGTFELPGWQGSLEVRPVMGGGAPASLLQALVARSRQGGERFRLGPRAKGRSLKKQFQARAVPAWAREGPLLFTPTGELVFVPGLGINGALHAAPGEPQLGIHWRPDAAPPAVAPEPAG